MILARVAASICALRRSASPVGIGADANNDCDPWLDCPNGLDWMFTLVGGPAPNGDGVGGPPNRPCGLDK